MTISVNHQALGTAVHDMVAKARDIKAVLDALDQDIRSDVTAWAGQAKAAYVPAKQHWDDSMLTMIQHLERAAAAVDAANADYYRTDRSSAGLFEGIPTA
jgi:WXG100 family type VII secretion target